MAAEAAIAATILVGIGTYVLTEDDMCVIARRCEELLNWFIYIDGENLTNLNAIDRDYLQKVQTMRCFDHRFMKDVVEQFEKEGNVNFRSEPNMAQEQLILAIICGIIEERNRLSCKFEVLCEALQLEKTSYYSLKALLGSGRDEEKTPTHFVVKALCNPIACCLALTMAYSETDKEQIEFEILAREKAFRQWQSTKAFSMNPTWLESRPIEAMRSPKSPFKKGFQIYKTAHSGWGVRALCDIPAGAFIANHVGAVPSDGLADAIRCEDKYFAYLELNDVVENEKAAAMEKCRYLDTGFGSSDDEEKEPTRPRSAVVDDALRMENLNTIERAVKMSMLRVFHGTKARERTNQICIDGLGPESSLHAKISEQ